MSETFSHLLDAYTQSAEMYDILSEQHWQSRRASVLNGLQTTCPDAKTILDIGSGTGMALDVVMEAFPGAQVHAIEPSASMRIGLMTRILTDTRLRQQVTVHPCDIAQATLPAGIDIALVCGCVGFFEVPVRKELWSQLASLLTPNGAVLVDVMPISEPQQVSEFRAASVEVGEHRYDIWLSGQKVEDEPEIMRWHTRFEQHDGEVKIRSFSVERDWRTFSLDILIDEAAEAGFKALLLPDSPVPAALLRLC
ncbi:class I SAM-dependent methyltransferase [Klebsiella pneumoniae]|uniref:class I SAM-dependent methyltransferase n=1 Tax=Klebsiella pneumoniae TaxID=573 RepID=UPI000E2D4017|nr:class I SAM-dependent methyltransferase [Klebsiella pneumoniae]SVM67284.1 Oxidoreductase (NAD-binding), involved in siderophore biosynthesis [Klebsiella pneumoniae]VTM02182.1 Oxidoreductase (NAD-binding), involved in siderophore biosynthesis [Klebsiella pneumoniae]HBQ1984121.1 class I SAM-dependent methyltransferase [Klebsiella pneumoniae]HBR4244207.1 class I SAM-dependent methyltransferase [Klebsiella pneumoniae]HCF6516122.1 class I SAM-dependent methyltransferase [Klebsiella pneumoniae]